MVAASPASMASRAALSIEAAFLSLLAPSAGRRRCVCHVGHRRDVVVVVITELSFRLFIVELLGRHHRHRLVRLKASPRFHNFFRTTRSVFLLKYSFFFFFLFSPLSSSCQYRSVNVGSTEFFSLSRLLLRDDRCSHREVASSNAAAGAAQSSAAIYVVRVGETMKEKKPFLFGLVVSLAAAVERSHDMFRFSPAVMLLLLLLLLLLLRIILKSLPRSRERRDRGMKQEKA